MTQEAKPRPIPESYRRVTPSLTVAGAVKALEFYGAVFGAAERMRFPGPDGTIAHAEIQIGDSVVMVEDEDPQRGTKAPPPGGPAGSPASLFIYVEDVDAVIARAVELGAAARLTEVLTVIYLLFNEGYLPTSGPAQSRDLAEDAEWLASLLHEFMPAEPEVAGLLALIRLHRARTAGRFDCDGGLVLLRDQDRSLWDREAIEGATRLLARAARQRRPGPYQLQAAIVACHAEAGRWEDTDWEQIVLLYDMPLHLAPSPVTRLHRAIALRYATGPRAAGRAGRGGLPRRRTARLPPLPRDPR